MRSLGENEACESPTCLRKATGLTYSRNLGSVVATCDQCEEYVIDEQSPEYTHGCENCGCLLPIN